MKLDNDNGIRVSKMCPVCGKRLFDKTSRTSGTIEMKCEQCKQIVKINLAFRMAQSGNYYHRVSA